MEHIELTVHFYMKAHSWYTQPCANMHTNVATKQWRPGQWYVRGHIPERVVRPHPPVTAPSLSVAQHILRSASTVMVPHSTSLQLQFFTMNSI